jgi:hypothetical protein
LQVTRADASSGGCVKVVACIVDPVLIRKMLTHLKEKNASRKSIQLPVGRAQSQAGLFD